MTVHMYVCGMVHGGVCMNVFSLLVFTLLLTCCFFRFQHQDLGYEQIGDVSELLYV